MSSSDFGDVLRRLRESADLMQREVAEAAGMVQSVLSRLETGQHRPPGRATVLTLAAAMHLAPPQTDELLEAAGYAPESLLDIPGLDLRDESLRALFHEVAAVRACDNPAWSAGLEEAMRIMLRGARLVQTEAITALAANPPPEVVQLTVEEEEVDDLLTAVLADQGEPGMAARLLAALEGGRLSWELRRRMTEALPRLVKLDARNTLRIAAILRSDYDPKRWHTDLRRRVVEAVPALYPCDEKRGLLLLEPQTQDQVYVRIATVEALYDIPQLQHADAQHIRLGLREHEQSEHVGMVEFLSGLLDQIREGKTSDALEAMRDARDRDRILRICIMRTLPRLFDTQAVGALWLMLHFYRRVEGHYAEHRYVRRPAAIAIPGLIALLDSGGEAGTLAKMMLWQLAQDDEHIMRRAVVDEMPDLLTRDVGFARQIVDHFMLDSDPYVRRRAWGARARLAKAKASD